MIAPHRVLKIIIATLVVALMGAGVLWEVLRVTAPPALTVTSPADNLLTDQTSVTLSGSAEKESTVTVNGAPIPVSADGDFKEELDLRTGLNVITISATKKFAKPNVIYRKVVVSGAPMTAPAAPVSTP